MTLKKVVLKVTTDASGDSSATSPNWCMGWLYRMTYIPGTLATGADLTVTSEGPMSQSLLVKANAGTSNVSFYPLGVSNAANDGTAGTTYDNLQLIDGKIKLVVAQGGNVTTGTLIVYYFD
jgi:hypothetical protein